MGLGAASLEDLVAAVQPVAPPWLRPDDRLLITGGNGWFGRTLRAQVGGHPHMLIIGSPRDSTAVRWEDQAVRAFAPTVVANFAFHTRDRLSKLGRDRFIAENSELTRRFLFTLGLDSLRLGLTISSGAALGLDAHARTDATDLYGALKAVEETEALAQSTSQRTVVVARAYSVSGPFVRRMHEYAFSDFVAQAAVGDITIKATRPVFRRYVAVSDLLSVSFASADRGFSGIIDSGGDLVEMQELAQAVRDIVNPSARIHRETLTSQEPSVYASDNVSWLDACHRTGINPMTLNEQVRAVERFVRLRSDLHDVGAGSTGGDSS